MLGDRKGTVTRPGLALVAALALMGCEDGVKLGGRDAGAATGAESTASTPTGGTLDVAAPDIFQVTEAGLWDGRPSLGGVWVAHPGAKDPERVRIVNSANGKQVIGALFRRERNLPGPALQVSSDAADALGMLAGAPANLEVTALRRRDAPAPAEAAPSAQPTEADQAPAVQAPAAQEAAVQAPAAQVPARNQPAAARDADAVSRAAAAIIAGAAVAPQASGGAIATTTLNGGSGQPASTLRSPFVQLGLFDQVSNATEAAGTLSGQGLPARVVPSSGGGWRLLLGPATTAAEQEALLARAVAAGFKDAYLVRS